MQITIPTKTLKAMLNGFGKILTKKNSLPVLGHALFEQSGPDSITASVTNLNETLAYTLPDPQPATAGDGITKFLFPVSVLREFADNLKRNDTLTLTPRLDQDVLTTVTVDSRPVYREVGTLPAEEFPAVTETVPLEPCNTLGAFLTAYRRIVRATSPDQNRRILNAVFADSVNGNVAGTDGRRLMLLHLEPFPLAESVIIPPSKILQNGLLDAETGMLGCMSTAAGQHWLKIQAGAWSYQLHCLDGNYPNYRQAIPSVTAMQEGALIIPAADAQALKSAINQLVTANYNAVAVFASSQGVAVLNSTKLEPGVQRPHLALANAKYDGKEPVLLALDSRFLLDALESGFNCIRFPTDPYSPMRLTPENGSPDDVCVIMPYRAETDAMAQIREFMTLTYNAAPASSPVPVPTNETQPQENQTMKTKSQTQNPATAPATAAPASNPESGTPATPESAVIPSAGTARTAGNGLVFVPSEDPVQDLLTELNTIQDNAADLLNRLKTLRQKARNVERFYKSRAREIESKSQLIAKFQKAVGF